MFKQLIIIVALVEIFSANFMNASPFITSEESCSKVGEDSIKTLTKITLYREFFKQKNYADAVIHWRYVFNNAPGYWQSTYVDGVKIYSHFIKNEKDKSKKQLLVDTLFIIYNQRIKCFDKGWERKAHDMYRYKQGEVGNVFNAFEQAIEKKGNNTSYFLLHPYFIISLKALNNEIINKEKLITILDKISAIIDHNIAKKDKNAEKYISAQSLIEESMPADLLSCEEAREIFAKKFEANPNDENLWRSIYKTFKTAGCTEDPLFLKAAVPYYEKEPDVIKAGVIARAYAKVKRYKDAVTFLKKASDMESDNLKKAEYMYQIAELYQMLNDFPTSRNYAVKASKLKPNWGKPYILIGDLYVSSGKLCGEGTGFDSQRVTWIAKDMYEKAIKIDPSINEIANEKIAYANKYLPLKEDCFMRDLKEGDSYDIPCWIERTTTVRFAKE